MKDGFKHLVTTSAFAAVCSAAMSQPLPIVGLVELTGSGTTAGKVQKFK